MHFKSIHLYIICHYIIIIHCIIIHNNYNLYLHKSCHYTLTPQTNQESLCIQVAEYKHPVPVLRNNLLCVTESSLCPYTLFSQAWSHISVNIYNFPEPYNRWSRLHAPLSKCLCISSITKVFGNPFM